MEAELRSSGKRSGIGESLEQEVLAFRARVGQKAMQALAREVDVRGIAHITGGGIPDNVPRCLPEGCRAIVECCRWHVPGIFRLIKKIGNVPDDDMYRTFNMGIGAIVVVPMPQAEVAMDCLRKLREKPLLLGRVEEGERGVKIEYGAPPW